MQKLCIGALAGRAKKMELDVKSEGIDFSVRVEDTPGIGEQERYFIKGRPGQN